MDENPFGGDEDDLAPIESKGEDDEATPSNPTDEEERIIGDKKSESNKTLSSAKKTSLWDDDDDDDDDNVQIEKGKINKAVGEEVKNKKKSFFGDEDEDEDSATTNVMSSFLSSKNDGPMSQMASYHEQTSYSCLLYTSPSPRD